MPSHKRRDKRTTAPALGAISSCLTKTRYKTERGAHEAAELGELRDMSLSLAVYQCSVCRAWHLTRNITPDNYPRQELT